MSKLLRTFAILILLTGCMKKTSELTIETEDGNVSYKVEEAVTKQELSDGLMNRKSLDKNSGMIFDLQGMENIAFWMKDTLIPLDVLFIDHNGIISYIHENAEPLSEELIVPEVADISFVLEINGGDAEKHNIKPGDIVSHKFIAQ